MSAEPREVDHPEEKDWGNVPVHAMRTLRNLRLLFSFTVSAAVLLPSLVLYGVPDMPQHGWGTSAGDVLWLTVLFAPGPAVLGWCGYKATSKAEHGVRGWPEPPVVGGAEIDALAGALIAAATQKRLAGRG